MLTFSRFGQKLIEKPLKLLSRQTLINTGTIVERYWNPNLPKGENMIKRTIVNRSIRSPLTIAGIDYFELSNVGGKKVLKAFGEKNCCIAEGDKEIKELIKYGKEMFTRHPYV